MNEVTKCYRLTVSGDYPEAVLEKMLSGVPDVIEDVIGEYISGGGEIEVEVVCEEVEE